MLKKHLIVFSLVVLVLLGFLFWKLFPLSPIALGFTKHELTHSIIYMEKDSPLTTYEVIDNYIERVEQFHNLKFLKKPRIYIFSNKNSFLNKNITKARFYAYPNNKLVVSPWAINESKQGVISLEIYIKHELSHILLYQNMNFKTIPSYPQWLLEGIAVYSVNQMGTSVYPSKQKTLDFIRKGTFFPPYLWKSNREDSIQLNISNPIAFKYSEFACIVDFLIERYGREKFDRYFKTLLRNTDHDAVFLEVFGLDFKVFLGEFLKKI